MIVECDLCKSPMRADNLKRHRGGKFCRQRCDVCKSVVKAGEIDSHKRMHENNLNFNISTSSPTEYVIDNDCSVEEELIDLYTTHMRHIDSFEKFGTLMDTFNYRINTFSPFEISYCFRHLFRKQKNAFRLSLSVGYVLYNHQLDEYAYYGSSLNNQLLIKARFIRNTDDKNRLIRDINAMNLVSFVERPSSQWIYVKATNLTFYIYRLKGTPIGSPVNVPDHFLKNKGLHCLTKSAQTGVLYHDHKCFFRSLSLFRGHDIKSLEKPTDDLLKEFCTKASLDVTEFSGVSIDMLEDLSRMFDVPIAVYTQDEERNTDLIYSSTKIGDKTLWLLLHEDHFMFIKDLDKFSSSYRCKKCDKMFTHSGIMNRHTKTCDVRIKNRYIGGTFSLKPTVFEDLELYGIVIPHELRMFEYRAVFDIECLQEHVGDEANSSKTDYITQHHLVSVSVCSNVPGFDVAECFVLSRPGQQKDLVKQMLEYLRAISDMSAALTREKLGDFMSEIEAIEDQRVKDRFDDYVCQLPVLTFNGGRYDLKIIRAELITILANEDTVKFVIKKGSAYMCIATEQLKFLDVIYYIAPGKNYETFLAAYGAKAKKSFFPYEFLDSFEKLTETEFPPYEAFYSSLKDRNTLEPPPGKDKSVDECVSQGRGNYVELKNMFEVENWNIKDYLKYYNNLDTQPFIEALENMAIYYKERGVDMFKDAVSVPGIAERLAFKTLGKDDVFSLFNNKNKDLVKTFLQNNVGGPAIIFDRCQFAGFTKIRHDPDGKDCKQILGLDGNALYLGCMAEPMPCGMFLRRRREDGFKKQYPTPISKECVEWLSYVELKQDVEIQHVKNGGEFRAGKNKRSVDGYCRETNTIYQYHGCLFHGCKRCYPNERDIDNGDWPSHDEKYDRTVKTTTYLKGAGFSVVEMWGCQWRELRKTVQLSSKYDYPYEDKYRLTEKQILSAILTGELFGVVEVDIEVPSELKDKFSEMTPIFKNTTVTRKDVGDYMEKFLTETKQNFPDTRYLIGSMWASKILLITPLAKWYLEEGLIITKVYQVVQFDPRTCFKHFAENVSNDRRAGDRDKSKAIVAETSKLIGNSVYGHTIMRKDLHTSVKFVDLDKASRLVNDPFFVGLEEFSDETFEVTSQKRRVNYDLPLQIGFFTYQYAKLKMLRFYFEVIDRFLDRSDFNLLEIDTDSFYLALSGESLEELISPDDQEEWRRTKTIWFPRDLTEEQRSYDKRTPGLFKVEWFGQGFVGLNAKSYFCYNHDETKNKFSSKGVSHSNKLTAVDYLNVLHNKSVKPQINRGCITKDGKMFSYIARKDGLKHFYGKRKVLSNGVSTTYLDI